MNIVLINGSPKIKNSTSGFLAKQVEEMLSAKCTCTHMAVSVLFEEFSEKELEILSRADSIVFIFPLYFDAVPSHFFYILPKLENYLKGKNIKIYTIVNCGFYEGKQAHIALDIIKNWCCASKLNWGQGLGIGAGEIIPFNAKIPVGHGVLKNLGAALLKLVGNIENNLTQENIFISPNYTRWAYDFSSKIFKWYPLARKNNIRIKDIKTKYV